MAGFETKQLKEGGFTALEFQLLGTISSELKKAGFSAAELRVGVGMCMRMCIVSPAFVPHLRPHLSRSWVRRRRPTCTT